ncbi:MAG: alpha-amylase family glycosyl hydrolase [Parvularculaceae bacterium]
MAHPWWKGATIYQIYPRSFFDADNDGVGDLPGATAKLDHIAALGVDGVWLSPFFASPMRDFGYDVADYRAVDPVFGRLEDFDALVARAHELGLKVVIDQVYSHTSDRHAWFQESRADAGSRKADWYVWADAKPDGTPPNNWLSVFGGPAWSWCTRRRKYYLHNFLSEQPDLNFHNPDVQDAILDVARFWLDRGVDGFRLDVANYYFHDAALRDNPPSGTAPHPRPYAYQRHEHNRSQPENIKFLKRLRGVLDEYDDRMSVAEIFSSAHIARSAEYTEGEDRLHTAYNFLMLEASTLTADLVRDALEGWRGVDAWPSWSFSNHDVKRVLSRWAGPEGGPAEAAQMLALLLALRGTVFLYQGEELGLPQADVAFEDLRDPEAIRFWPDNLGRDGCRTPMPWTRAAPNAGFSTGAPWLPVDPRHAELAVDAQANDPGSTLSLARRLLKLRRDRHALRLGDVAFLDVEPPLVAFERRSADDAIVCGFNLSDAERALPAAAAKRIGAIHDLGLNARREGDAIVLPPRGAFFADPAP